MTHDMSSLPSSGGPGGRLGEGPGVRGRWVVLKFGGTSVSTRESWRTIASLVRERIEEGLRPLLVGSALSGVTDALEEMLGLAVLGRHEAALHAIEARHLELGRALGLDPEPVLRGRARRAVAPRPGRLPPA